MCFFFPGALLQTPTACNLSLASHTVIHTIQNTRRIQDRVERNDDQEKMSSRDDQLTGILEQKKGINVLTISNNEAFQSPVYSKTDKKSADV